MRYYTPGWVNMLLQSKNPKTRASTEKVKQRLQAASDRDDMLLHQSPAHNRYSYTGHGEASLFD